MAQILNNLAKGMIRNTNQVKKDPQFYNFALNISTDRNQVDRLTRVTERKLEDYYSLKNVDYVILNVLYLNIDEYVYFITDRQSTFSEILYYNKGQLTTKYNNSLLNFNAANIISSTYRINYNGDRLIYFVDGLNKDRVFNLDNIELSDNIESISISPIYDTSGYTDYTINYIGGTLPSGKYYIFIQPRDINGKTSQYKNLIDGIPIENGDYKEELTKVNISTIIQLGEFENETNSFNEVYGLPEDSITSKSITLDLSNLDSNYTNVDIYVVIKNDTTYRTFVRENITLSDKFILNDLSTFTDLGADISSILVDNIIYNNSETLIQKDNRLLLANSRPEGYNKDFQIIANGITVKPLLKKELFNSSIRYSNSYTIFEGTTRVANTSSPSLNATSNEKNIFSTPYYLAKTQKVSLVAKTFMRDEVYALGMYFELDNGVFTDVYHIPGRVANDSVTDDYTGLADEYGRVLGSTNVNGNWDTNPLTIDGETKPAWQLINTALEGLLGYYRCDTVYPSGYGFPTNGETDSNGNSYIRHHRIPSEYIYQTFDRTNITFSNDFVLTKNMINLQFDNIVIPTEYQSIIKKIHFCIADRTESDKKVLSKGIVYANRNFDGIIRNSETLNAPVAYDTARRSNTIFEFKSAEVDFNFKNTNIKGSYIKPTNAYVGWVNPIVKTQDGTYSTNSGSVFPVAGSTLNYEGINRSTTSQDSIIYDYKQELTLNRVNYREPIPITNFKQYRIQDMIFFDNNTVTSFAGSNIKYEGNQNTSIFKLVNNQVPTENNLFTNDDLNPLIPSIYKATSSGSSGLFRNFYSENRDGGNIDWTDAQRNVTQQIYYDSTLYVSILSNNTNIFSDILNLTYSKIITDDNNVGMGDSFIENHFTKKGYSTLITDNGYFAIESVYNIIDRLSNSNASFRRTSSNDLSVSESYISFPVETRLNIRLRRHDTTNNHFPYNFITAQYPVNELEKKALSQEVYSLYNKYKDEKSIRPLFTNNIKVNDLNNLNRKIGHRIIYSELQNNESNVDNFRNFLANNYKDIITTKGSITKLFIKDNNLFIITRDSLFRINSSNNFLTTRGGNEITVGTGEFLGTDPEELIALETGFAGTSSKLSFSENKFGYVFVDKIRNKILLFNKTLLDINALGLDESLELELLKVFPQLDDGLDKPLLGYGILTGFDPETERIFVTKLDYAPTQTLLDRFNDNLITINNGLFYEEGTVIDFNNENYFENKSITLTFDGINNTWISYHNYFPNYYIPNPTILKVKLDDISKYGEDYADKFIMDITMNENFNIVKIFDSLKFDVQSEDNNGYQLDEFFNQLILYNDKQSTGLINLNSVPFNNNLTKKETYWNYNYMLDNSIESNSKKLFSSDWNLIKDQYFIDKVLDPTQIDFNKPWNKKHRFRDKYLNIRLIKDNINNRKFYINFLVANVRQSIR